jgi:hypothetical protein
VAHEKLLAARRREMKDALLTGEWSWDCGPCRACVTNILAERPTNNSCEAGRR